MPHLLAERASHACEALDVLSPARAAGWLSAWACVPGELPGGVAWLGLGSQAIPVRLVVNEPSVSDYLERLARMLLTDFYLEQFVIMEGFTPDLVAAFNARVAHRQRRIHVGTYAQYIRWVAARLGSLGQLPGSSPVRKLLETFITYSPTAGPATPVPMSVVYADSDISNSLKFGALGVQAVETLLCYGHGYAAVQNVEANKYWQSRDVDLLVSGQVGAQRFSSLKVEVKNENFTTKNFSLEKFSSFDHKTPGWLRYSEADVLISGAWPTGDFVVMDFKKVRDWILSGNYEDWLKLGHSDKQKYKSQFYCTPLRELITRFDDVFCVKIDTWLPEAYGGRFAVKSLVEKQFLRRQLQPIR